MCNHTGIAFVKNNLKLEEVFGKNIIESGSRDVNGSVRPDVELLNPGLYIGTDLVSGHRVDRVCDATDLVNVFGEASFDILISTEALEHVKNWHKVISNFKRIIKPGGLVLITTRSIGFLYHEYPSDHWRYELEDMQNIFSDFEILVLEKDTESPGIFVKARKPKNFVEKNLRDYELYSIVEQRRMKRITEMIGNAPKSSLTGVPGWLSDVEDQKLAELARNVEAGGAILQIGGEFGRSASVFCQAAKPDVSIGTIDLFPNDLLTIHRDNLAEAGFANRSVQYVGDSKSVFKTKKLAALLKKGIDLLFIDGDHSYEGAKADIDNYTGSILSGGIVAIHDCVTPDNHLPHYLHFEVQKAANEWQDKVGSAWNYVGYAGNIQIYKKK
jgi:predicted O-methyltransferase YrrM